MLKLNDIITSRQNPTVKLVCSLAEKKKRQEHRLFRFDGIKLLGEAIEAGLCIEYAIVRERPTEDLRALLLSALESGALSEGAIVFVSEAVFSRISEERAPEGVITVARFLENKHRHIEPKEAERYSCGAERILIAESLRDPGNLGTVVRSCAALGIGRLIVSDDCADLYNPKTIRAAMGGLFRLSVDLIPAGALAAAIRSLRATGKGRRVYAAALGRDAREIGTLEISAGDCFVIGNEGHGLSESVIDACDACAIIPMAEGAESLNAAAAAAICIWETVRA